MTVPTLPVAAAAPVAPAPTAPGAVPVAPAAPAAPAVAPAPRVPTFTGDFNAEQAAALVTNLRGEVDAEKTKRQGMEAMLAQIAKAVGIEDAKPDPEKLVAELAASRAATRTQATDFAVFKAALKLGADADALADSRAFTEKLAGLDPTDTTFTANVEKAVSAALEANPRYKASTGAPQVTLPPDPASDRSGGEFAGSPGQARQVTEAELRQMTPDQIVAAREAGLLDQLLGNN